APLRAPQGQGGVRRRLQVAEPGADVDAGLRAEPRQLPLEAGILAERLDEAADRVERRQVHLLFQSVEAARREALDDPGAVVLERELRLADQEGVRAEAVEGRQPALGGFEIGRERLDVA